MNLLNHTKSELVSNRLVLLLLVVALASCQTASNGLIGGYQVSQKDAICRATRLFPEQRYGHLENYDLRILDGAKLQSKLLPNQWVIHFQGKGEYAEPGGWCTIYVDKKSGKARILDGK